MSGPLVETDTEWIGFGFSDNLMSALDDEHQIAEVVPNQLERAISPATSPSRSVMTLGLDALQV